MKNKILLALLVLVVTFSLVGCGSYASEDLFYGYWSSDNLEDLQIASNGEWALGHFLTSWEVGEWIHNGDNSITLLRESEEDENLIAIYHTTDEGEGEDRIEKRYLQIGDKKYYYKREL